MDERAKKPCFACEIGADDELMRHHGFPSCTCAVAAGTEGERIWRMVLRRLGLRPGESLTRDQILAVVYAYDPEHKALRRDSAESQVTGDGSQGDFERMVLNECSRFWSEVKGCRGETLSLHIANFVKDHCESTMREEIERLKGELFAERQRFGEIDFEQRHAIQSLEAEIDRLRIEIDQKNSTIQNTFDHWQKAMSDRESLESRLSAAVEGLGKMSLGHEHGCGTDQGCKCTCRSGFASRILSSLEESKT